MYWIFLCALFAAAVPAWAGEQPPAPLSPRWASWFSSQDWQSSPMPARSRSSKATLTPTVYTKPSTPASVRDLTRDLSPSRTEGLLASTTWLKGTLAAETELSSNSQRFDGLDGCIPGQATHDASSRMMRLGLTGVAGAFRYGVKYRSAGRDYYDGSDQANEEIWGEWRHGRTTLSSAVGQQWNNVAADPLRPRLQQNYRRLGLSWQKPDWPLFSLTYQEKGTATQQPAGPAPQSQDDQTVEAALGYSAPLWTARVASSYSILDDALRSGTESRATTQTATAAFRPFTTLTIAPTVGYRTEHLEWTGARIDAPSLSLAMNYRQSQRLLISATGNYSGTRSSDRLIDLETVGGTGLLAWDLQQSPDWATLLSLEAGFNRQINHAGPSTPTENVSGILRLVVAPF